MDPEMMRLAQEQMSRMRPEDLQKMQQQMMRNPDLLRMASEGMKNIRSEDLRMAAEQMKNMPPDQIADMSARMANASPEEIASMSTRTEAMRSYAYQGALNLKSQGNQLHGIGKFSEAAEKYARAKSNLNGIITSEAKRLQVACSLNLMSCYLKTKQYQEVIAEGTEVLKGDAHNLKALYRRGQAYRLLKELKLAVSDLRRAAEISPDDETISDILSQARVELEDEGGHEEFISNGGPIIEEITTKDAERLSSKMQENTTRALNSSSLTDSAELSFTNGHSKPPLGPPFGPPLANDQAMEESLNALSQNPEMIRNMHSVMSNMNPEHLAALSGGGLTPDMAKMAADMVKNMSPAELERMVGMASHLRNPDGGSQVHARPSGVVRQSDSGREPASATLSAAESELSAAESQSRLGNVGSFQNLRQAAGQNSGEGMPSMADFSPEMQEQVRLQMKDPAMKQMMASMVKSMTPEAMSSMSAQMGLKLSPEEAAQAQKAMANFSLDDLDRIMRWAERAQSVTNNAKRAKDWLLGRSGLILALAMLVIAIILQRLGYIG